MIQQVLINNYALINNTNIELDKGFSIITGETGAGKSILLGAIGLTLGQRAESGVLHDRDKKCIVEITYNVMNYNLKGWFAENDLDYEEEVVVRREITGEGRSRAFINDTPVNVRLLKEFGSYLIDIHSQHQSLLIGQPEYQITILDEYSGNQTNVQLYKEQYKSYVELRNRIIGLKKNIEENSREREYLQFQLSRLQEAELKEGEQEVLESELNRLNNAENIKSALFNVVHQLRDGEENVLSMLKVAKQGLNNILDSVSEANEFENRLSSAIIELRDIAEEAERVGEYVEYDRERIDTIDTRLSLLYGLCKKHGATDVNALIELQAKYEQQLEQIDGGDEQLILLEQQLKERELQLLDSAKRIHIRREERIPGFCEEMNALLRDLGIKHANFVVNLRNLDHFTATGRDEVQFLFGANKNQTPGELAKVASGGEISRVMLSLKYILSKSKQLPVMVFDEIDTGVSGEVAHRMAQMMKEMAAHMQVISISHLPQLASAGDAHFKVYKDDSSDRSVSLIKRLSFDERVNEIAGMISGSSITAAALETAKALLR
ncbi:MAG: DNA repair protein RecN [Marinifilaceae bacterium]